jgi:hypothetical protein
LATPNPGLLWPIIVRWTCCSKGQKGILAIVDQLINLRKDKQSEIFVEVWRHARNLVSKKQVSNSSAGSSNTYKELHKKG